MSLTTVAFFVLGWCTASLVGGLVLGPILRRRRILDSVAANAPSVTVDDDHAA